VIGGVVREAVERGGGLIGLGLEDLRRHSEVFAEDVVELLDVRHSLSLRNLEGGTGPEAVEGQMEKAREVLGL